MKYFKKLSVFLAITLVICGFALPSYADGDVLKETDSLISVPFHEPIGANTANCAQIYTI